MDEVFNNQEYFNNEHSKFKQEMLELGFVQEGCFWVRQDSTQTHGGNCNES